MFLCDDSYLIDNFTTLVTQIGRYYISRCVLRQTINIVSINKALNKFRWAIDILLPIDIGIILSTFITKKPYVKIYVKLL